LQKRREKQTWIQQSRRLEPMSGHLDFLQKTNWFDAQTKAQQEDLSAISAPSWIKK
jgi:hypothetical protein